MEANFSRSLTSGERSIVGFVRALFGISCCMLAFVSLFACTVIGAGSIIWVAADLAVGALAFSAFLIVIRRCGDKMNSNRSMLVLRALNALFIILVPLSFVFVGGVVAALFAGIGLALDSFLLGVFLLRYTRSMLDVLIPSSLLIAVFCGGGALVIASEPLALAMYIISMLVALLIIQGGYNPKQFSWLKISSEESAKRARSVKYDRWTFSTIGLDLGFSLIIAVYAGQLARMRLVHADFASYIIVAFVPTALACAVVIITGAMQRGLSFRNVSKNLIPLAMSLGILPMLIAPNSWVVIACAILLLFVSLMQFMFAITASIEFIRYQNLSPAWYMGEEAFISCGIAIGAIVAFAGFVLVEGAGALEVGAVVLVLNILAESFMQEGRFPSSDYYKDLEHEMRKAEGSYISRLESEDEDTGFEQRVTYMSEKYMLTPRQTEVLRLLARGRNAKYISEQFVISLPTAKSHIASIYQKVNVHSMQQLITLFEQVEVNVKEGNKNKERGVS